MRKKLPYNMALLEKEIGYTFKNKKILNLALTHSSFKYEQKEHPNNQDNERLEFLGDAILSLLISKALYKEFEQEHEGILSKYRSILVSREHLFKIAKKIKLINYLHLGKSEQKGALSQKKNISSNAFEALIAAIYLDGGMKNAEKFTLKYLAPYLNKRRLSMLNTNYKSALQEYSQKNFKILPVYLTNAELDNFKATVEISKSKKAVGLGNSKRAAEQAAARNLLKKIKAKKVKKK